MHLISTAKEKQKALQILVYAYLEAANVTWMLKSKSSEKLHAIFLLLFHEAQAKEGAYLSEDQKSVLFLYDQQIKANSLAQALRKLYVFLFVTGISKGMKALKFQKIVAGIRPKEGLLGMALATAEKPMTTATVFELKHTVVQIATEKKLPIYAETTVPRLKSLYEAIGFKMYHEMPHPYAPLTVWFLKRELTK
ncbi:MAG: hypothetical protein WC044_09255 [Crocinitomicaceae bacterium]